jgi:hypothetical protein
MPERFVDGPLLAEVAGLLDQLVSGGIEGHDRW